MQLKDGGLSPLGRGEHVLPRPLDLVTVLAGLPEQLLAIAHDDALPAR